jgi:hypothetical protein
VQVTRADPHQQNGTVFVDLISPQTTVVGALVGKHAQRGVQDDLGSVGGGGDW